MRRLLIIISLLLLLTSNTGAALGQDNERRGLDAAQVPRAGGRPEDFVPRGWQIQAQVAGDLNNDSRPDYALHLVPNDHDADEGHFSPETHALLLLLAEDEGRLRRAGLANKLLMPAVPHHILEMTITNGVLITNQTFGWGHVTDVRHRFRYEPASGRFLLIGKDTRNHHRLPGPQWPARSVSENYLTGVRLTTTERWLNEERSTETTRRERIARARIFLEDVDGSR